MQGLEIEAVYEKGTLKLARELPLAEGQKVTITIYPQRGLGQRLYGLLPWKGSQEDLEYLLGPDNHPWADDQ
jgi:predicted DNA-binding antitoxin AbrB/MazE fold protein